MGTPINPNLVEIVKVTELPTLELALENYFAHCGVNGALYKINIQGLVDYITPFIASIGGSGYVSVNGNVLPDPIVDQVQFSIVGLDTYTWSGGELTTTDPINVLSSNGVIWDIAVGIPIYLDGYLKETTATTPIEIDSKGFKMTKPGNLDSLRGPYADVDAANAAIENVVINGKNFRELKFVEIGTNGTFITYWWNGGYTDANLTEYITSKVYFDPNYFDGTGTEDDPIRPKNAIPTASKVSNFITKIQNGALFISWKLNGNDSVVLEKSATSDFAISETIYTGSGEVYLDNEISGDEVFFYRIKGVKLGYNDSQWSIISGTLNGLLYINGVAKSDMSGIDVTIIADATKKHKIQRSINVSDWNDITTLNAGVSTYSDLSASKGIVYYYRAVKLSNTNDEILYSNNLKMAIVVGQLFSKSTNSHIDTVFTVGKHDLLNFSGGAWGMSFRVKAGDFNAGTTGFIRLFTLNAVSDPNRFLIFSYDLANKRVIVSAQAGTTNKLSIVTADVLLGSNVNFVRYSKSMADYSDVHFMFCFNGKAYSGFKMYVDGEISPNASKLSDTLTNNLNFNASDKFYIGGHPDQTNFPSVNHNWHPYEFILFSGTVNDAQAKAFYNQGAERTGYSDIVTPIQWYDFKDDNTTVCYDKSINPVDGLISSGITKSIVKTKGVDFTDYVSAPLGAAYIIDMKKTAPIGSYDSLTERKIAPLVQMGIGSRYSVGISEGIYMSANLGPYMGNNFEGVTMFYDVKNQIISSLFRTYSFNPGSRDGHETLRINQLDSDLMTAKEESHNGPVEITRTYGDLHSFESLSIVRADTAGTTNGLAYPQIMKFGSKLVMIARGRPDGEFGVFNLVLYASNNNGVSWPSTGTDLAVGAITRFYPIVIADDIDGSKWVLFREPSDNDSLKSKGLFIMRTDDGVTWSNIDKTVNRDVYSVGSYNRTELRTLGNKFLVVGSQTNGNQAEILGWSFTPLGKLYMIAWINFTTVPINEVRIYSYNSGSWTYLVMPLTASGTTQFKHMVAKTETTFDIFTEELVSGFTVIKKYAYNLTLNTKDSGTIITPTDNNASLLRISENIDPTKTVIVSGNINDGTDFNNMWIYPYVPVP